MTEWSEGDGHGPSRGLRPASFLLLTSLGFSLPHVCYFPQYSCTYVQRKGSRRALSGQELWVSVWVLCWAGRDGRDGPGKVSGVVPRSLPAPNRTRTNEHSPFSRKASRLPVFCLASAPNNHRVLESRVAVFVLNDEQNFVLC